MSRWIGVDYGTRRIGTAISDVGGSIASPGELLEGTGGAPDDADRVLNWARQHEPAGFVVGLPLNMDGSEGPQAKLCRAFARHLRDRGDLPVELWDERLSSFQANETMKSAGLRRTRRERRRDALAAQVILQSFLDAPAREREA